MLLTVVSDYSVVAVWCRWEALLRLEELSLDFRIAAASKKKKTNQYCQHGVGARSSGQVVCATKQLPADNLCLQAREDRDAGPDSRVLFFWRYSAQTEEGECCSAAHCGRCKSVEVLP